MQSFGDSDKLRAHSAVEVDAAGVLADFDLSPRAEGYADFEWKRLAEEADTMLVYWFGTMYIFGIHEMDKPAEDIDDVCCFD